MRRKLSENSINSNFNKTEYIFDSQILPDGKRTIAEDYLEFRLNLHIHIRFDHEEFCAVFDGLSDDLGVGQSINKNAITNFGSNNDGNEQIPMLIKIAQFMETPQVFERTIMLKRLNVIDDTNYCGTDPLELSPLITFVFNRDTIDGEFIPGCGYVPFRKYKLPNEMVKRASKVIEQFTDSQAEIIRN